MTGAEHYARTEQIIADVESCELSQQGVNDSIGLAQVHATLALAAAVERQTGLAHGVDTSGYGR